ncbi:MAG: MFS transporter [Nannocystaceae bacterium]|nr:MFS transporter [Nannocystaceae bacterium]
MPQWIQDFAPILILLIVIGLTVSRLPRIEVGHTAEFRARRIRNWMPVGLLYAFLYMGRYNLTVAKGAFGDLMSNGDFATIFGVGTAVYGASFIINGPLTDRIGGKKAVLIGATGSLLANAAMGWVTLKGDTQDLVSTFSVLYGINMYFQSFGAVSIVKINAPWFHVRERGVFGAIFGILISLGIYFAFDVGGMIADAYSLEWVFFTPSILLAIIGTTVFFTVKNTPGEAGVGDFDTEDASSGDDGPRLPALAVFKMMLTNSVVMTIAAIEFCSGFLRQAIMQWYRAYAKGIGQTDSFVYENWGMLLCCAGIIGGVFAGTISDHIFGSRRGPVAATLYGFMLAGSVVMVFLVGSPALPWTIVFMSMCIIGVHGMLSGTASMDFGGRKNVGVAVGIIDGFVYAGTAVMSFTYGEILPDGEAASDPDNWIAWPMAMVPMALLGLLLARRVWNAKPKGKAKR